jgi:oligopeptide/dipeptide ABC transporter ATP-binding protein
VRLTTQHDDQVLVDIRGLFINFYTYQGIVKAIDGIDLVIKKGETLGLVGETGCGKSVTASSIIKLVMSPPGKIEAGNVFFMEPPEVRRERLRFEDDAQKWYEKLSAAERKKLVATYGVRLTGFKKRVKDVTPKEIADTIIPPKAPRGVVEAYMDTRLRKAPKSESKVQDALSRKYDLLTKSNSYMQKIRGRFISMIFQEPTSALNPVFTAGDQIAEVILQHRRSEMAERVLRRLEDEKVIAVKEKRVRSKDERGHEKAASSTAVGKRPVDAEAERWYEELEMGEKQRLIAAYDRPIAGLRRRVAPVKARKVGKTAAPERIPPRILRMYSRLATRPRKIQKDWRSYPFRLTAKDKKAIAQKWYDSLTMENRKTMVAANSSFLAPYRKRDKKIAEPKIIRTVAPSAVPHNLAKTHMRRKKREDRKALKHHLVCSICETEVDEFERKCHNCSNRFYGYFGWQFKKVMMMTYSKIFKAIAKDPLSKVSILANVPIVRRYRSELYDEAFAEATAMLKTVRIPDPTGVSERYPHELSGGMQQRVMIAIALACNPKLLIADEPTTALDVTIQAQILKLMRDMKERYGSSILLITHNLGVVAEMCDRVGVMYAGSMAEIGDARTIFKSPRHPYTMGLMKSVPSAQLDTDTLYTIRGTVPNLIRPPTGCRFHPRCDFAKEYCMKVKPELTEIEPGHGVACHMVTEVKEYASQPWVT